MKVDHRIKDIKVVYNCIFIKYFVTEHFLSQIFYLCACTYFFSFIEVYTHLRHYTTIDVHFMMCALHGKKQLKELMDQKKKKKHVFDVFPMLFFKLLLLIFGYVF